MPVIIRKLIKNIISSLFDIQIIKPEALQIITQNNLELTTLLKSSFDIIKAADNKIYTDEFTAEGVVFSKDRPLQLHALLYSYYDRVTDAVPLKVLYSCSNDSYKKAYSEVSSLFDKKLITWHEENSFQKDLLNILHSIKSSKIFFLVDDIVFTHKVCMTNFTNCNTDKYVPSLRLGENIQKCYMRKTTQKQPIFRELINSSSNKLVWLWKSGQDDWGYPLSVDGNLFSTTEMTAMAKIATYTSPNKFERALQNFNELFLERYGICYRQSTLVNIPHNKVQTDFNNDSGSHDPRILLEAWNSGKRFNTEILSGFVNESPHQELPLDLINRDMNKHL